MTDALAVIGSAVDVTVTALENLGEESAAVVLHNCVSQPLTDQRDRIGTVIQHLAMPHRTRKAKVRR